MISRQNFNSLHDTTTGPFQNLSSGLIENEKCTKMELFSMAPPPPFPYEVGTHSGGGGGVSQISFSSSLANFVNHDLCMNPRQ